MAGFNKKYLLALIDQIKKEEEIPSALESMNVLDIPLDIASDLKLEQVLTSLTAAFKQSIDSILGKLAVEKETDKTIKKGKTKKDEQARKRRAEKKGSEGSKAPKKHTALFKKCMKMRKNINVC